LKKQCAMIHFHLSVNQLLLLYLCGNICLDSSNLCLHPYFSFFSCKRNYLCYVLSETPQDVDHRLMSKSHSGQLSFDNHCYISPNLLPDIACHLRPTVALMTTHFSVLLVDSLSSDIWSRNGGNVSQRD
jgi:hypothetical protein